MSERSTGEGELVPDSPVSPTVSRLAGYTSQEQQRPDEWSQAAAPLGGGEDAGELVTDYGKLGQHVTSVLESARAVAARIRDDAREDARRVAERARKEATETLEGARRDSDKVSAEAEQLRAEVEKESRETRRRANAYLTEKRQDAEGEATEIVTRAKREASEHTRASQERRSALDKNVALTEERLGQLVGGLRDLAGRLEELLRGEPAAAERSTDSVPDGTSLEESLRSATAQRNASQTTELGA